MKLSRDDARRHIKDQMPEYLASQFGVKDLRKPFRCLSPDHSDNAPSMQYNRKNNTVHCFSCGATYDTLELIAIAHNISKDDHAGKFRKAYEIFNLEVEGVRSKPQTRINPLLEVKELDPVVEAYVSECHARVTQTDYFKQRGLSEDIISQYRLGYDPCFTEGTGGRPWQVVIVPIGDNYFIARNIDPGADKLLRYRKPKGKDVEFFNIAALEKKQVVYIVEGEVDALSVLSAGAQAIGLGSAANTKKFLQYLESHKPKAFLVISPDNDEAGEKAKAELVEGMESQGIPFSVDSVAGEFKDPNEALVKDKDSFIQDVQFSLRDQTAEMEAVQENCPEEEQPEALVRVDDLEFKEADFLIDGILEADSLTGIFGASGSGKSFFVFDMLASVAAGIPFHGRATRQAPTIYLAAEGKRGLAKRNKAWNLERWNNPDGKKDFFPVMCGITLPDDEMENKLLDLIDATISKHNIATPGAIAIDTLARTLVGDENSNTDMSAFIRCMDRLKSKYPGVNVSLVHHTGHNETGRARGASSLKAALDCEIRVEITKRQSEPAVMTVACTKSKDSEEFAPIFFEMRSTDVFYKESGEAETSLYLVETASSPTSRGEKTLSASMQLGLDSFNEALKNQIEEQTVSEIAGVHVEAWRPFFYKNSTADQEDSKRRSFDRTRSSLVEKGLLEVCNDVYRIPGIKQEATEKLYQRAFNETESGHLGQSRTTSDMSGHCPEDTNMSGRTRTHTTLGVSAVRICPEKEKEIDSDPEITEVSFKTPETKPEEIPFPKGGELTPAPSEYSEVLAAALIKENPEAKKLFQEKFDRMFLTVKNGEVCRAKCLERTWELFQVPTATAASQEAV